MRRFHTILLLAVLVSTQSAHAESQNWVKHSVAVGLASPYSIGLTGELRHTDVSFIGDTYVRNIKLGITRKLGSGFFATAAYQLEDEDRAAFTSREHRFLVEGGWKKGLANDFTFDTKARIALRTYREPAVEDHVRIRLRLRLTRKMKLGSLPISPYASTELFGDTKDSTDQIVNRNRFFVGSGVQLTGRVKFSVSYMRQDSKGKAPLHALASGFSIKL